MMLEEVLLKVGERLKRAQRVLIVSHIRPDGDAVGSVLGLGLALEFAGKTVQMVLEDGVPDALRFIPESDRILTKPDGDFDTVVVVDAADFHRIGEVLKGFGSPDINIDHHVSNTLFGQVNLVESEASATSEILAERLPEWGFEIPPGSAQALLTGLLTDTIGFRISSVQPKTLRLGARLMELGANLNDLYTKALLQRTFSAAKYWGAGLSSLKFEDGLVWCRLTLADRAHVLYEGRDDADLINILSGIREAEIALIFVEQAENRVKISWRAKSGYDVSAIAANFGGGGHRAAAGADVVGSLAEVQQKVLAYTRNFVNLPSKLGEGS